MFKKIGADSKIVSDLEEIKKADKILLPGVGAFDNAMKYILNSGLKKILDEKVLKDKVPIFGICLGMQLLTNSSEEGTLPGFGWINAETKKFRFNNEEKLKVPHMGWNSVVQFNISPLINNLPSDSRFYFVHSYYVKVEDESHSILKSHYGITFDSVIQKENIFGAQFHPEKSHKYGMKIFENFAKL